jgi:hypothetical protein
MSGLILIPLSFAYTGSGNKFRLPHDRTQNLNPENEIGKEIHATISTIDQFEKKMHHGSQTQDISQANFFGSGSSDIAL